MPAANLLLLQRLLSLLQRIGHNASTSRMTSSNLAVCLGPNLLSPPNEDQLPLQAMLEVTAKVRCREQPPAAFPHHQSLAVQRSLPACLLSGANAQLGGLPGRAAPHPQPSAQRPGAAVRKAA